MRGDDFLEARPLDVLHDQEVQFVVLVDVVGANDVRVIQTRQRARLAHESLAQFGIAGVARAERFHRDLSAEPFVERDKDAPHSARADLAQYLVA